MFTLEEAVIGAAVEDAFDFFFPFRTGGTNEVGVASLPVISDEVVELLAGLIEFDGVAHKIEQWDEESAGVGLIAPELQRGDSVAAFAFVEGVVLIAGAVMNFVAVNELKVLDDELAPSVVDVGLGCFHIHRAGEKFFPGAISEVALIVVSPEP